MKSIKYSFIAMLIISILAISCTNNRKLDNSIKIKTVESNVSNGQLEASAKVINNRLRQFTYDFKVDVIAEQNQIKISFDNNWDSLLLRKLILQKGDLAIYKLLSYGDVKHLLGENSDVFGMFNELPNSDSAEFVASTDIEKKKVVNKLLAFYDSSKSTYLWGENKKTSEHILYALDINNESTKAFVLDNMTDFFLSLKEDGEPKSIGFSFKDAVVHDWADYTRSNINSSLAFVIDNEVISVPKIMSEISSGKCQVSGSFSSQEYNQMYAILSSGTLPLSFEIIE